MNELAQLCRRIGISLDAGIDVRKMWQRECENSSGVSRRPMQVVLDHVRSGDSLTNSLAQTGRYFPNLVHELVAIGESTGRLDEVFKRLASHYEGMIRLRRVYIVGIIFPAIQLALALIVVAIFIVVLGMIGGEGASSTTFGLTGASGALKFGLLVAVVACSIVIVIQVIRKGLASVPLIAELIMRIPVVGTCLQIQALARMAWCLSLIYDTGMEIRQGMKASLDSTNTIFFSGLKPHVDADLLAGQSIHATLAATRRFPSEFLDTVEVGEQSGKLGESLLRLSRQYEDRAKTSATVLVTVASVATWGLVAAIIIFFIFRVAMIYINAITDLALPS